MKNVVAMLIIGWSVMFSSTASADGNDLLRECGAVVSFDENSTLNHALGYNVGQCIGFLQGITRLNELYQHKFEGNTYFCIYDHGVDNKHLAKIIVKYLEENPEKLHLDAVDLALLALIPKFPCK